MLEEDVQLGVALGVARDLEERHEEVVEELLEAAHQPVCVVHVTEEEREIERIIFMCLPYILANG